VGGSYDVIVVGCGSVGSAATFELAKRRKKVLALDRYSVPHTMGSHHGSHRIYRFAYAEGPQYVPLMRDAYERWMSLESRWHEALHLQTGGLDLGYPGGRQVDGAIAACVEHDLDHEVLDAAEIAARYPAWRLPDGGLGVFQRDAGMLFPERCIAAMCAMALVQGAQIRHQEPVMSWGSTGDRVWVETDQDVYEAESLVLAGGGWNPGLVPLLDAMRPTRQVLCWITPTEPEVIQAERFPVWLAEFEDGEHFYGFPERITAGMKLGWHDAGPVIDPTTMTRVVDEAEELPHRAFCERYLPSVTGPTLQRAACLYTMSPDEHFVLDVLPEARNVVVFSGDSGHAFKFASALGAICADLATMGATTADIDTFRLDRPMA
jgi:sarcosine oxidase